MTSKALNNPPFGSNNNNLYFYQKGWQKLVWDWLIGTQTQWKWERGERVKIYQRALLEGSSGIGKLIRNSKRILAQSIWIIGRPPALNMLISFLDWNCNWQKHVCYAKYYKKIFNSVQCTSNVSSLRSESNAVSHIFSKAGKKYWISQKDKHVPSSNITSLAATIFQ